MVIRPTLSAKKSGPGIKGLMKSLETLAKKHVLVGIQEKDSSRPGEPVNNAELAFLHTEGSPAQRIPARPFLQPGILDDKEYIAKLQIKVIEAALSGNATLTVQRMNDVGKRAVRATQGWFTNPENNWPPNSKITIALKGSDRPLIDTDQLRRSITYAVVDE